METRRSNFPTRAHFQCHLAAVRSTHRLLNPQLQNKKSLSLDSLTPPFPPPAAAALPPSTVQPLSPTLGGAIHAARWVPPAHENKKVRIVQPVRFKVRLRERGLDAEQPGFCMQLQSQTSKTSLVVCSP